MVSETKWTPGEKFAAPYPFVREVYTPPDPEEAERPTWRPGVRSEFVQPDDFEPVADGLGRILLTVVSAHKPGRYPERVFFTRQWEDPDGRAFGKSGLHIATAEKFRRLARGYQHEFRLVTEPSAPRVSRAMQSAEALAAALGVSTAALLSARGEA